MLGSPHGKHVLRTNITSLSELLCKQYNVNLLLGSFHSWFIIPYHYYDYFTLLASPENFLHMDSGLVKDKFCFDTILDGT